MLTQQLRQDSSLQTSSHLATIPVHLHAWSNISSRHIWQVGFTVMAIAHHQSIKHLSNHGSNNKNTTMHDKPCSLKCSVALEPFRIQSECMQEWHVCIQHHHQKVIISE